MTTTEFKGLSDGVSYSDVPDGTEISLAKIKQKLGLVDSKKAELLELKTAAKNIVNKLSAIGI